MEQNDIQQSANVLSIKPGHTIRATGDIKDVHLETLKEKATDNEAFIIDTTRCDVCGDCYTICPADAIEIVIDDPNGKEVAPN